MNLNTDSKNISVQNLLFISVLLLICNACSSADKQQTFLKFKTQELQQKHGKSAEELNFHLESIEKIREITAADSIQYFDNQLIKLYKSKNKNSQIISFEDAIIQLESQIIEIQESIIIRIQQDRRSKIYDLEQQKDQLLTDKQTLENWKSQRDNYSKDSDEVLSVEYSVVFSYKNPLSNQQQNYRSLIYTDSEETRIIREVVVK